MGWVRLHANNRVVLPCSLVTVAGYEEIAKGQ